MALLTACVEYDDPSFVPVTGAVKHTQLALSASGSNATTRMSAAITQADEQANGSHFRGISDLFLLPFQITKTTRDYIEGADTPAGQQVVADNNTIPSLYNGANSKYYLDVAIPIGTNAFLVYGRATGNKSTLAEKQTNGILQATGLTSTVGTTPSGISFSPVPMVTASTSWTKRDAIITYLNSIFNANWANGTTYPVLNGLYDVVKAMKAGSSASVLAFIQEIYDALKGSNGNGVGDVITAIKTGATVDTENNLITALPTACQGYPTNDIGLPDGAAVISWNESSHAFEAVTSKNNFNGLNTDVNNFVFPAELYYRANSRIHTSEVEISGTNEQVQTIAEHIFYRAKWNVDDGSVLEQPITNGSSEKLFTPNGMVFNNTTIVAITDPLQYAVSRLDLRLEAKNGSTTLTKLVDKAGTEFDLADLPITGILVGQQSPVDYLFQSKWQQDTDPLYTIYDNAIEGTINAATNVYTHTLVLETAKDQTVNVAIELQNNSGESILTQVPGDEEDQIIPSGCKFYLVGQLVIKSEDGNGGYTYIDNYSETNPAKNRVFCQDHVTQVTFTVSDLKNAYYVIPPLSNVDLEFSLKVIDWKLSTPTSIMLE
jgi:hypothetical protein